MLSIENVRIAVIGLGYVGLPLAVELGRHFQTIGYDINRQRVAALRKGIDSTQEVEPDAMQSAAHLTFADDTDAIADATVYIVTVPTPIDAHNRPDLRPLEAASDMIGGLLKAGDTVIYESTVYPGCTEEICLPRLEAASGLRLNTGFFLGYSPERINPGDKAHRLPDIRKITSASTPEAADFVDALYNTIIRAGTHKASSIRVAEAAKVIENTQRDLNIALINELAIILNKLEIDTAEVLEAAGTKWNFLPFKPGLVGGHCIGVDPYYLAHKAQEIRHHPEVILAGRRINDSMGTHIVNRILRLMIRSRMHVADARVLILGLTFKENCPDLRNTGVVQIMRELKDLGAQVDIHDPWVDPEEALREYGIGLTETPDADYDVVILAVAHGVFLEMGVERLRAYGKPGGLLYDVKSVLPADAVDGRL